MVLISNGFSKFHLSIAAAEAERHGMLSGFITGAYPTPAIRKILNLPYIRTNPKAMRLKARQERIADPLVHALFSPEMLNAFGTVCKNETAVVNGFSLFGRLATKHVERAAAEGARIYHYRAGCGGPSVETAKKLGMVTLCDHSIAHPALLDTLVQNMGRVSLVSKSNVSEFNLHILRDIEQADAVLVNSTFVKDTFTQMGANQIPMHVIYLGVDDAFLASIPERKATKEGMQLLFAGYFEKRKGAETLMQALDRVDTLPWKLEIAGGLNVPRSESNLAFLSNRRVKCLGLLSRTELAAAMTRSDVFVFPSLAEGSARVVFEALACGCYVITTPNAGSIVEDGVHGRLVPPGDAAALAAAIEDAVSKPSIVAEVGLRNANLVRENYRQCHYGDKLANLYSELLNPAKA
jgi:glycosyltransferase involved in cell wall biosynthesis